MVAGNRGSAPSPRDDEVDSEIAGDLPEDSVAGRPTPAVEPSADPDIVDEIEAEEQASSALLAEAGGSGAPPAPSSAGAAYKLSYPMSAVRGIDPPSALALSPEGASPARRIAVLIGLAVVVMLLYWGKPLLLPLSVAVLLSFLLSPLSEWLERRYVPRAVSVVLVVTLAFALLGALGWAVFNGVMQLAANIDRIDDNLEAKLANLPFRGGSTIERVQKTIQKLEDAGSSAAGGERSATLPATEPATRPWGDALPARTPAGNAKQRDPPLAPDPSAPKHEPSAAATQPGSDTAPPTPVTLVDEPMTPLERAGHFLGLIAGPLGAAGLVVIFTLFILLQRDDLRDRVIKLAAGHQLNLATQALDDATTRISKYLVAQAIVNGTYGLAVGVGLELLAYSIEGEHFPSVWLWALLCATLRFIPYLGPWVAAVFPITVSVGWWPGYEMFVATAGYFIIIELLSNNVMEPILYGSSTGMSPVAVILAAAFWTFVWGPVGLLVATPLTTCLVVLGKYVPALRFFDILLGDEPVLTPQSRLYQRMLAMDAEDAEDVVEDYRKEHTLTETFDDVLLPALTMAERDRHAGHLTSERVEFIHATMQELVNDLGRQEEPLPSDSVDLTGEATAAAPPATPAGPPARVVVVPSVDRADATAALMLKYLLDRRGMQTTAVDAEELASEKLEQVFSSRADVAVISAVPPRATARARYLVKRLHQAQTMRGQDGTATAAATLVGLWTIRSDTQRAAQRIKADAAGADVRIVTSLAEAVEAVRQRAQVVATKRAAEVDAQVSSAGRAPSAAK